MHTVISICMDSVMHNMHSGPGFDQFINMKCCNIVTTRIFMEYVYDYIILALLKQMSYETFVTGWNGGNNRWI